MRKNQPLYRDFFCTPRVGNGWGFGVWKRRSDRMTGDGIGANGVDVQRTGEIARSPAKESRPLPNGIPDGAD